MYNLFTHIKAAPVNSSEDLNLLLPTVGANTLQETDAANPKFRIEISREADTE